MSQEPTLEIFARTGKGNCNGKGTWNLEPGTYAGSATEPCRHGAEREAACMQRLGDEVRLRVAKFP
jgi:hypothetical protein